MTTETPATRRPTRQRAAIAAVVAESAQFQSAQELHARLQATGSTVGLATVYRALQAMAAEGEIDVRRTEDGETVYRSCSVGHHHHLVCRVCGRTVEVEGPTVERWLAQVSAQHGFTEVGHTVDITGMCAECSSVT